jgi:hypothetical protein
MIIQSSIGKWSLVFWGTYERISYGGWGAERRSIEIPTFTDMMNIWRATRTQPQGADERVVMEAKRADGRSGQRAIFRCVQKSLTTY